MEGDSMELQRPTEKIGNVFDVYSIDFTTVCL